MYKINTINIAIAILSIQFMLFSIEPIKWACGEYAPAYYRGENGDVQGYLYDIAVEALETRMNIPVEITFLPWKRCQLYVEEGSYDIMFTIPTAERLEYSVTHETPAWIKRRILYTYINHPRLMDINSIQGLDEINEGNYTILSYIGNGWVENNVKGIGIPVEYAPDMSLIFKKLANKRGDIIIEDPSIADDNIRSDGLDSLIIKTSGIGSESSFHIFISKESAYVDIIDSLNLVIEEMWEDGTIEIILSNYGM